ncbi:hypothetical protein PaecuDRAFT_3070 [Paenibacillus curdlanolyticus YK9]|uniref:Uncharacterized protein n=1 Tax=Paenibacillus curdlanolyticus YK9 TaxID=717606 RepID=E0IBN1_9BACL|nr:hypothetical protein [Paenibacillus curdlanolyticus]EFM10111.1 hypothetical protein PaecuDRAFT_3070 [Paenibacillus curdlanolyticus YK9]
MKQGGEELNRIVFYLITSVACLLVSAFFIIYMYWDASQPKVGPVGDGNPYPSFMQMLPIWSALFVGATQSPRAIYLYVKQRWREKRQEQGQEQGQEQEQEQEQEGKLRG